MLQFPDLAKHIAGGNRLCHSNPTCPQGVEAAVVPSGLLRSPCLLLLGAEHLVSRVSLGRSLLEMRRSGDLPRLGHGEGALCGR